MSRRSVGRIWWCAAGLLSGCGHASPHADPQTCVELPVVTEHVSSIEFGAVGDRVVAASETVVWLAAPASSSIRAFVFTATESVAAEVAFPHACVGRAVHDSSGDVILNCLDRIVRVQPTGALVWTQHVDTQTFGARLVDVTPLRVLYEATDALYSLDTRTGALVWRADGSSQACRFDEDVVYTQRDGDWERVNLHTGADLGAAPKVTLCETGFRVEREDLRHSRLTRADGESWLSHISAIGLDSLGRVWGTAPGGVAFEDASARQSYCTLGTSLLVSDFLLDVDPGVRVWSNDHWVNLIDVSWGDRPLHITSTPSGFILDGSSTRRPVIVSLSHSPAMWNVSPTVTDP